ncbi:MAG TPA: hypothetical protein VL523_04920 [Terriglobia bacterium]|nr:hypothetical protein [Terriglobia bacterium]
MKRQSAIAAYVLLLIAPALAAAQGSEHPYRGQGYLFLGLGFATPHGPFQVGSGAPLLTSVGVGGEGFPYKGLGFGAEVNYASAGPYGLNDAWIGSADFSYHFGRHSKRGHIDPFLLSGFSVVGPAENGSRGLPAGNFGGGANWWLGEHTALRLEFRDHIVAHDPFCHNIASFRVGVTFR